MNWTKIALFGGLAAGAYYALNYFAGGIQYAFSGIKMLGLEGLKLKVSVRYSVTNKNDISATVTGLNGRIFYGGYELNQINLAQPVTIAPGATEEIDLRFTILPGSLLSEILRFFENKDKTFRSFLLRGTMTGKIGAVPFAYPLREQLRLAE
jgi:LEA14-like dessication related protein